MRRHASDGWDNRPGKERSGEMQRRAIRPLSWRMLWGLCALALASSATAQDEPPPQTRQELLRQQRLAKRQQPLVAYRAGWLERGLLAFEKAQTPSFLQLNLWGFYPRINSIERGSNVAFGVRFWRPDFVGPLDLHASTQFSVLGYENYDLQLGLVPHQGDALPARSWRGDDLYELRSAELATKLGPTLYASLRYQHRPEESFFGLGAASRRQDETSFLLYDATYDLVAGVPLRSWLALTLRTGYLTFGAAGGSDEDLPSIEQRFDDTTAPGLAEQPDFLHVSPQLLLDFRDVPGNPHRGGLLGVEYALFDDRGGDAFRFTRLALDGRAFLPLWSVQRVLALRALYFNSQPMEGSRVPFYLQETLGGSHTLRGSDSFRFRGEDVFVAQAEYRWEGSPAIELALFADAGTVSDAHSELRLDALEWDWGYGIRFKSYRRVGFRFDHAFGEEESRLLLRLSASY